MKEEEKIITPSEVREGLREDLFEYAIKSYDQANTYCIIPARYEEDVQFPYDKEFWQQSIKATAKIYKERFGINPQEDRAAVIYETAYLAAPRFYESVFRHLEVPTLTISFANKEVQWIVELLLRHKFNVIQTIPLFALQLWEFSKNDPNFPPKNEKIKLICSSARIARGFSIPISKEMRKKIQEKEFELLIFMGATDFLLFGYNDGNSDPDEITLMNIPNLLSFKTANYPRCSDLKKLIVDSANKACRLKNYFTGDLVEVVREKKGVPLIVKFKGREEEVVKGIYDWQIRKLWDSFRDKVVGNYEVERAIIYKRQDLTTPQKAKSHFTLRIPVWKEIIKNNRELKKLENKISKKWNITITSKQQTKKIQFESTREYYSLTTEKIFLLIEKTVLGEKPFGNVKEVLDRLIESILILRHKIIIPENVKVIVPLLWTFAKDIRIGGWESDDVRDIFFSEEGKVMQEYKNYVNKISKENISVADILFTELIHKYNPLIGIRISLDKEDKGKEIFWEEKKPERFLNFRIGKENKTNENTLSCLKFKNTSLKKNLKKLAPIFSECFNKLRCFYYFPTSLVWEGKELKGFGGMILCCDKPFQNEEEKIKEIHTYNQTMWSYFSIWEWANKSHRMGLRNIVISIMTHAFAHDIGSHGLVHISEWLKELKDRNSIVLADINKNLPYFTDYLFQKAGFWAWLAASEGDAVYGEFMKISELKERINQQKLLLRNLIKSELGAEPCKREVEFLVNGKKVEDGSDGLIWFPYGGNVGFQAFSTIIETIIRNLKHYLSAEDIIDEESKKEKIKQRKEKMIKVGFTVKVNLEENFEDKKSYWKVSVWDGKDIENDKTKNGKTVWEYVKEKLNELRIMDENGFPILRGRSEMLICTTILRGKDITTNYKGIPDIIKLEGQGKGENDRLIYTFRIWKGEPIKIINDRDEWKEIEKRIKCSEDTPYRFKFLLTKDEEVLKSIRKIRKGLIVSDNHSMKQRKIWTVRESSRDNELELMKSWLKFWKGISAVKPVGDSNRDLEGIKVEEKKFYFSHRDRNKDACIWYGIKKGNIGGKIGEEYNKLCSDEKERFLYHLAGVLMTKVLVVDERLHDKVKNLDVKFKVSGGELSPLEWCRERLNFILEKPSNNVELKKLLEGEYDIAVFHSSLLERLLGGEKKAEDFIQQFKARYVFITSGMGEKQWFEKVSHAFISYYDLEIAFVLSDMAPDLNYDLYHTKENIVSIMMAK